MLGEENSATRVAALIQELQQRVQSLRGTAASVSFQPSPLAHRPFTDVLRETLDALNEAQSLPPTVHREMRRLFNDLSALHILPTSTTWSRRFFYEQSYLCTWEIPKHRFVYKALDALSRANGYERGWDDPQVADVREQLERHLSNFCSIQASAGWGAPAVSRALPQFTASGDAALEVCTLLIRLFYVEGLATQLLAAWQRYERFIYVSDLRYRDHFVHLLYDFMMGAKLLDNFIGQIHSSWQEACGEEITIPQLRIRLMRSWVIASLFHDIGYPAEKLHGFREALQQDFFTHIPGCDLTELSLQMKPYLDAEIDAFLTLLSFLFTEDEFSFTFQSMREFEEKRYYPESLIFGAINSLLRDQLQSLDHGVMSALFLLLTLKVDAHEFTPHRIQGAGGKERREAFRRERAELLEDVSSAVLAIALHNIRQRGYRGITVDFRTHPIAFMLMLCDDLHEWDRDPEYRWSTGGFASVFGYHVFPRLAHPADILGEQHRCRLPEDEYEMETFRVYMSRKVTASRGRSWNARSALAAAFGSLAMEAGVARSADGVRARLGCGEVIKRHPEWDATTQAHLAAMIYQLTEEVITITYIGGDPATRGLDSDHVTRFWTQLRDLFFHNLSNGPAMCVFHGYNEDEVSLFFAASYSRSLRAYRVEESLRPQREDLVSA